MAVFWSLPKKIRLGFLAFVSLGYLLTLDPFGVSLLVGWAVLFYQIPHAIVRGKLGRLFLPGLVMAVLGYLAYFKYVPRFVEMLGSGGEMPSLVIPLGISYFTFKLIHYSVEVVRGNVTDRSFSAFCCYVFLFPIFTAGPIERFDHFLANREEAWQLQSAVEGITRICHGLIKKFLFCTILLEIRPSSIGSLSVVLEGLAEIETYKVWCYFVIVYLYAYMDFSAYSDIAIGASRLFGLRIMENFNFPILAPNIGNFWKRWHMTLAGWCQAYIYMPMLGLTRNPYVAVFSTFFIMGVWHALTLGWISWGLYHALGVSVYLTWLRTSRRRRWTFHHGKLGRCVATLITFAFVAAGFSFTVIHEQADFYDGLRLFAKLLFVNLPT